MSIRSHIAGWVYDKFAAPAMLKRPPDFVVAPTGEPYLKRWWLIPRNNYFNVYLHLFLRDDDDRALHDHPWVNFSWLLYGSYVEHTIAAGGVNHMTERNAGDFKFRMSKSAHRIELKNDPVKGPRPCVTIFVTGPRVREWGFHCPKGWVLWTKFVEGQNIGKIGKGCDQ